MTDAQKIRVVFMGTPLFACPALKVLAVEPHIEIAAVVTQPDRPAGRGQKLTPPPVKTLADELGLPVFQTQSIRKDEELKNHLRSLGADFHVTVAFGQILTQEILDIPKLGTVNAHASLLPEFRGANPIQCAILAGKAETGITTMLTERGVDTGPMLLRHVTPIGPEETMGELTIRLSEAAGPLLVETLIGMQEGRVRPETQPHELATHAPKCEKEDAVMDWSLPAVQLQLRVRAYNPAPGAATFLNGERIKILRAALPNEHSEEILKNGQPGEILGMMETGIMVRTGDGALLITSLQPAGKREMPARDWAVGTFRQAQPGQSLGRFTASGSATEHLQNSGI